MTDTLTFDPALADGIRRPVGFVGVDSGTMRIQPSALPLFGEGEYAVYTDDEEHAETAAWDMITSKVHGIVRDNAVYSSTGLGDGGYEVVQVLRAEQPVGVEVVFLSPSVEADAEQRLLALELPRPSDDDQARAYGWGEHERAPQDDPVHQRVRAWDAARNQVHNDTADALIPTLHPSEDGTPHLLGTLLVRGEVTVGDPLAGGGEVETAVVPGQYAAVTWTHDLGEFWGVRVVCLGVYRLTD